MKGYLTYQEHMPSQEDNNSFPARQKKIKIYLQVCLDAYCGSLIVVSLTAFNASSGDISIPCSFM